MPIRQRHYAASRLRLEALEDRCLLTAAFAVNLYQDNGGTPGALITGETVQPGEKFFAEITAADFDPRDSGLQGVSLDISWNPTVLTEINSPFDPRALITPNLPVFLTGTLDNQAGNIRDLGGSSFTSSGLGRPIGRSLPEEFALLHFQSLEAGESRLSLDQGRSQIVTEPVSTLWGPQIDFESPTITVAGPSEPSQVASITTNTPTPATPVVAITPTLGTTTAPTATLQTPTALESADTAAIGLQTKLYTDNNGQQGSLISPNSVTVGESFFVEIAAADLRNLPQGIGGLSVNVSWNPAILQEIDQPFNPASTNSPLVTAAFPLFRSGSLDNVAGQIEDLGGVSFHSSGSGVPIGKGTPERFSLLHFRAIAAAPASPLSLAIGTSGIGLVGETAGGNPTVNIAQQTITVVAPAQPPQIAVTRTPGADPGTIQFTTDLGSGPTASVSTLVRPAFPDTKQFVDIKNTGGSPLAISQIQINAPDVTTDVPSITNAAGDLVLAPGETRRIGLTYAPTAPNPHDPSTQSFQVPNGLVIVSNSANAPQIGIALEGASTFDADINYDGRVNIADVVMLDDHVGDRAGNASFDRSADPNGDGTIDLGDFGPLNVSYGAARATAAPARLAPLSAASQSIVAAPQSIAAAPLTVASAALQSVNQFDAGNFAPAVGAPAATDAVFGTTQTDDLLPAATTVDFNAVAQALTIGGLESTKDKTNVRGSALGNTA